LPHAGHLGVRRPHVELPQRAGSSAQGIPQFTTIKNETGRSSSEAPLIDFSRHFLSSGIAFFFFFSFSFTVSTLVQTPPDTMTCIDSDFSMMHDNDASDVDLSDSENQEATVSKKIASSKGLSVVSSNVPAKKHSSKTIENQYRKLTQREHCLVRPDTYIGSVEPITETMFILDAATQRIVSREITYTPGLFKIFDESEYSFYL
jgi:hypothetical protein